MKALIAGLIFFAISTTPSRAETPDDATDLAKPVRPLLTCKKEPGFKYFMYGPLDEFRSADEIVLKVIEEDSTGELFAIQGKLTWSDRTPGKEKYRLILPTGWRDFELSQADCAFGMSYSATFSTQPSRLSPLILKIVAFPFKKGKNPFDKDFDYREYVYRKIIYAVCLKLQCHAADPKASSPNQCESVDLLDYHILKKRKLHCD